MRTRTQAQVRGAHAMRAHHRNTDTSSSTKAQKKGLISEPLKIHGVGGGT